MDYKKAGVDIEAGYKSVELMKEHVKSTMRPEVLGGIGGFSGAFSMAAIKDMEDPVLYPEQTDAEPRLNLLSLWTSMTQSVLIVLPCALMTLHVQAVNLYFSLII